MGWKIVEIENGQSLNLFLDNIVITTEESKITLPLNDIDVLLINNYKLKITIQLINALSRNNILTIICNNDYLPESLIVPIIGNYNTIKVLDVQLQWNPIYKARVWKNIIKNKMENQAELLNSIFDENDISEKIIELTKEIKDYDISNREGHASKIYWHKLFGSNFKRFENDYCNMLLNYGYTILRSYMTRSIIKKGLDPRISFFHKSFHNYFSLSSDLMEPFRCFVDKEVFELIKDEEQCFFKHKEKLIKAFNNKILIDGKKQFINNAIDIFVDSIVNQGKISEIRLIYE